jgi:hypothetical protein
VPTIDERVAFLEGTVREQGHMVSDARTTQSRLEIRMDARFDRMDARFDRMDARVDGLDEKMTQQFHWLVGLQLTLLAAMVVAFATR